MKGGLAPLAEAARGRVRQRQPLVWRLQQMLSNYLPLALMAVLAVFTTWLVRQAPSSDGPMVERPVRQAPDYEMRGFELQRFAANGSTQAWVRGEALRHYPTDDRLELDRIQMRLQGADGSWLLVNADRATGPEKGDWLRFTGQVQVRRFAPGSDPGTAEPVMTLNSAELLAERHGSAFPVASPRGCKRRAARPRWRASATSTAAVG
jgi:lipopolysaccharide export system protein LptC